VKPAWYQVSTGDHVVHPDNQRRMSSRMNARGIIQLDSSHASPPFRPGSASSPAALYRSVSPMWSTI
jgi:hypothetical protein